MELLDYAAKMKADWDQRAREDPRHYIATGASHSEEAFDESARRDAALLLRGLEGFLAGRRHTALEIGCGIGRMLRVLAPRFAELHGVDVSGEMVRQARERLHDLPHIFVHETNGLDLRPLRDASFGLVFSFLVFQHVPASVVAGYCREATRVLAPGGLFRFQYLNYARLDGTQAEPPPEDTFTLRSVSDAELRRMLDDAGLEPLTRLELVAPDNYVPGFRGKHVWMTCRRRPWFRPRWWRRAPALVVEPMTPPDQRPAATG